MRSRCSAATARVLSASRARRMRRVPERLQQTRGPRCRHQMSVATSGCTCAVMASASCHEPSRNVVSRTRTVPRVARSRKSAISSVSARCRRMPPWPSIDARNRALWSKQLRNTQSTPPHLEAVPFSASRDALLLPLESCLSIDRHASCLLAFRLLGYAQNTFQGHTLDRVVLENVQSMRSDVTRWPPPLGSWLRDGYG